MVVCRTPGVRAARASEEFADEAPHFPGSRGVHRLAGFDEGIAQIRLDPYHQFHGIFLIFLLFSFTHKRIFVKHCIYTITTI